MSGVGHPRGIPGTLDDLDGGRIDILVNGVAITGPAAIAAMLDAVR